MIGVRRLLVPALAAVLCATTVAGQPQDEQPQSSQPAAVPVVLPPRVGVAEAARELTLGDAIRLALEQNNDVEIARLDVGAASQDVRAAEGAFDPLLLPSLLYQRATTPVTSSIGGAAQGALSQDELAANLQFMGRAPRLGSRLTVDLTAERLATNNQFARLNPQFPASLSATYVQPLLRNLRIDEDRRQVELARRAQDLTDAQLSQVLVEQLTQVEEAYWELVYAASNVDVQIDALAQARGQLESNERQALEGTLAPIDVVEAQTQVATFEQSAANAQQTLTDAENRLKSLILTDRHAPMWNQPLTPRGASDRSLPALSLDEALKSALARRPELARMTALEQQNEVDRRFFRDRARPRVDLVGTYALAGLAGTRLVTGGGPLLNEADAALYARLNDLSVRAGLPGLDVPDGPGDSSLPESFEGSLSSAFSNLLSRRYPTAAVQLQMELPVRNRTAEADIARSDIARQQLDRQRRQLEQAIEVEVRGALQRVQSSERRLAAASSAMRSANEQYESERRRFEAGLSTVFFVLQRQTALVAARGQELRARADLNQAAALLDRSVGGTLERHGVQMTPPAPKTPGTRP